MGGYLSPDPAVEKWVRMRESTAKHFQWNGRNIRTVAILGLVIPAGITTSPKNTTRRSHLYALKGIQVPGPLDRYGHASLARSPVSQRIKT
ncbi:unnamed protein product [Mortierella alpina]